MANRDDYRGYRGDVGREPWRREGPRQPAGRGGEQRSFGEEGRFNSDQARYGSSPRGGPGHGEDEPWRRDRYGSRFDQDHTGYGSGYDREHGGYGRGQADDASRFGGGYGGQEYGMEGHGGGNRRGEQYGAPQDYANQPQAGREFDSDYLHWREEQLRIHDRDYQDWRRHQQEQHDEEYRKFRTERRDTFGRNFLDWRAQRNTGSGGGASAAQASGGSEFGKTPPEVQATTDGGAGRGEDAERKGRKDEPH